MLFNSYEFIYIFLPVSFLGFLLLSRVSGGKLAAYWLILLSIVFYGQWSVSNLILLLLTIVFNYLVGKSIIRARNKSDSSYKAKILAFLGIAANLSLLGYFKYTNFLIATVNGIFSSQLSPIADLVLPLGISFYTFEQISYLIGVTFGKVKYYPFHHYLLFVVFFPHLIAGPILNPNELIPQFKKLKFGLNLENFSLGATIFSIGLFKKVVIADYLAVWVTPVFSAADSGNEISFLLAWQAAIAYTLQLYFDFSGYSDMAVGLGKIFNIQLPINFFSPYKADSIIDFWRRWHISLSRFLRDYIYIPLGGSRGRPYSRYVNLMITMFLGGLWHGANWTFVIWGVIHGGYLCINHAWNVTYKRLGWNPQKVFLSSVLARLLTFLLVVISWVVFRAGTFTGASKILSGMVGINGLELAGDKAIREASIYFPDISLPLLSNLPSLDIRIALIILLALIWFLPNVYEYMANRAVALDIYHHLDNVSLKWYSWQPNVVHAFFTSILLLASLLLLNQKTEFLYFQF